MEQKQISEKEFFSVIARELFNGVLQQKQMLIDSTNDFIESAVSPIIHNVKYGIIHFKKEEEFRFIVWQFTTNSKEPKFRQVQLSYKDILNDLIISRGKSVIDVADRMYKTLLEIEDKLWDDLIEKIEKEQKFKI